MDLLAIQNALRRRYRLDRELGRGGMGVVYQAFAEGQQRRVALKVISAELAGEGDWSARLAKEARLAAKVSHRNVVKVFEYDRVGGEQEWAFIAYELVEGESLRALLDRESPLDPDRVRDLGKAIAEGLDAIHAAGILHRDIKPENVLLSEEFGPKITDLGIAKEATGDRLQTRDGIMLGTPPYMSPEQILGEAKLTPALDVYALGCMLYEMLTGQVPFDSDQVAMLLSAHVNDAPRHPSQVRGGTPRELGDLILECLAKRPGDRPTAAALAAALESSVRSDAPPRVDTNPSRPRGGGMQTMASTVQPLSQLMKSKSGTIRLPAAESGGARSMALAMPAAPRWRMRVLALLTGCGVAAGVVAALPAKPGRIAGLGPGIVAVAAQYPAARDRSRQPRCDRLKALLDDPKAQVLRDCVDVLARRRGFEDEASDPVKGYFADTNRVVAIRDHLDEMRILAAGLQADFAGRDLGIADARRVADALMLRVEVERLWVRATAATRLMTDITFDLTRWAIVSHRLRKPLPSIPTRTVRIHRSEVFSQDNPPLVPALRALLAELDAGATMAAAQETEAYRTAMRWMGFVYDFDEVDRAPVATKTQIAELDAAAARLPKGTIAPALMAAFRTERYADGALLMVTHAFRGGLVDVPGLPLRSPLWQAAPETAWVTALPWCTLLPSR